jgi:hypothetical protein
MNTLLISPFSDQARVAWFEYLAGPKNTNLSRPDLDCMGLILQLIGGKPHIGEKERCLRHDIKNKYALLDGCLYFKKSGGSFKRMLFDSQVYDKIIKSHLNLGHAGVEKTYCDLEKDFYGITRNEVGFLLEH